MAFLERLGGLLGPAGLAPDEQRRLGQQSLLAAGLGILGANHGRNAGLPAIGQGLLSGLGASQQFGQQMLATRDLNEERQRRQQIQELVPQFTDPDTGAVDWGSLTDAIARIDIGAAQSLMRTAGPSAEPAEMRALREQARVLAAQEGTSEQEALARLIRLRSGMDPRATSAAPEWVTAEGADGRKRAFIFDRQSMRIIDPETGAAVDPNSIRNVTPMEPSQGEGMPQPSAPVPVTPSGMFTSQTPLEEAQQRALGQQRGAQQAEAEPLPGSELHRERRAAQIAGRQLLHQNRERMQTVDRVASDLERRASAWTAGLIGSASASIPGTPAHDLAQDLNTLKAVLGFSELQAMRDASPTGGALGQVSEMENRLLQSAWAALEQSQSPEQFRRNMRIVVDRAKRAWRNVQEAYEEEFGSGGASQDGSAPRRRLRYNPETGKVE